MVTRRQFISGAAVTASLGIAGCLQDESDIEFAWEREGRDLVLQYIAGPDIDTDNITVQSGNRELNSPFTTSTVPPGTNALLNRGIEFQYGDRIEVLYNGETRSAIEPTHESYPLPELTISWEIDSRPDPSELVVNHDTGDTINGAQLVLENERTGERNQPVSGTLFEPGTEFRIANGTLFEPGDTIHVIATSMRDETGETNSETIISTYSVANPLP